MCSNETKSDVFSAHSLHLLAHLLICGLQFAIQLRDSQLQMGVRLVESHQHQLHLTNEVNITPLSCLSRRVSPIQPQGSLFHFIVLCVLIFLEAKAIVSNAVVSNSDAVRKHFCSECALPSNHRSIAFVSTVGVLRWSTVF